MPTIRITLLADNHAAPGLASEHGLSFWIEAEDRKILFDTGQGAALTHNASALGIRPEQADLIVLSHGHYDHTGNLADLLPHAHHATLCLHPAATRPRFSIHTIPKSIGMPPAAVAAVEAFDPARVRMLDRPMQVTDTLGITGPIPRADPREDTGGPFFYDQAGKHPDPIPDDQALWCRTDKGLVVCLGCCHAGLLNTLKHITGLTGERRIHAVIGGMHLLHASPERLAWTAEALSAYPDLVLIPCHCTGETATHFLSRQPGLIVEPGQAGITRFF